MKTYKYKLYNNQRLKKLSNKVDCFGIVWNYCLAITRRYYRFYGKHLSKFRLQKHLTKVKRRKPLFKSLDAQAIQQVVERLDMAYTRFFEYNKAKKTGKSHFKAGPPKFKKVKKYKSFTLKQSGWKLQDNILTIFGSKYKFWKSRELEGQIKTLTIKRDRIGDFYVSIVTDAVEVKKYSSEGNSCGIDFGLRNFLVFDSGKKVQSPEFFKRFQVYIKKANQSLSTKRASSNNRRKANKHLARLFRRISNLRNDFNYKLSHFLCQRFSFIGIESLDLQGMKSRFGKKVSDLCFAEFIIILQNVSVKYGTDIVKCGKYFPSSQLCSSCGNQNKSLSLRDRNWTCTCGIPHNRDENAAKNILAEARRLKGGAPPFAGACVRRRKSRQALIAGISNLKIGECVNSK